MAGAGRVICFEHRPSLPGFSLLYRRSPRSVQLTEFIVVYRCIIRLFAKIIYKHFLQVVGIEPTVPSNPHLVALAYTGNGRIQLPKVWSANTYRHSLISKVVGVPVREKAAYFFLSLLPYIYIITIFLEFFKL